MAVTSKLRNRIVGFLIIVSLILLVLPVLLKDQPQTPAQVNEDIIAVDEHGALTDENGAPLPGQFKRVPYKMGFFDCFFNYVQELRKEKPIVVCGDFNIAHQEIDLARPKTNTKNTGFLPEERAFLDKFTAAGYVDTFRLLHPGEGGHYTWWSYKTRAREKNVGWRIDYFFVSEELKPHIKDAVIENQIFGSDHCPIGLTLEF